MLVIGNFQACSTVALGHLGLMSISHSTALGL